jgi:hypothetical protein
MIKGAVLAVAFAILLGAASQEETRRDDHHRMLIELSSQEADFRGCDRANPPDESRTAEVDSTTGVDIRANDRDWCHVNDFWSNDIAGLYTMTGAAEAEAGTDPAIKLIELSVFTVDEDGGDPR